MPARLHALWLLTVALLRTLLRLVLRRGRNGISAFPANYDADGLPPLTQEERGKLASFSRCIACGLCDRGEAQRIADSGGAYRGTMALVLAASRSMPDFRAAAYSFSFVPEHVLAEKERVCPTGVPFREIALFVRDKAEAVGGPLPLPPKLKSLAARSKSQAE